MPKCTRIVSSASLSLKASRGADEITFDGQLTPTRRLRPGSYTVTITASNASGSSKPQVFSFTIVA